MNYEEKVSLLVHYSSSVDECMRLLIEAFNLDDYSDLVFNQDIPKRGKKGNLEYYFHGIGCRVVRNGHVVDWDFYPVGNSFIFDIFKINEFLKFKNEKLEFVDEEMLRLVEDKILTPIPKLSTKDRYVFHIRK